MKKFFMLLAALAIVVALPSCGGGNEKNNAKDDAKELTITEKVNTTLDGIVEILETGNSKPEMTEQESVELTNKALALMKDYEALQKSCIRHGDGTEETEEEFFTAQFDWYQKHYEESALINDIARHHDIRIYIGK